MTAALAAGSAAAEDSPVLQIYGSQVGALIVGMPVPAVGEPAPAAAFQKSFDERLRKAVAFHGALAPLDRKAELPDDSAPGVLNAGPWKSAGAELVLRTRLLTEGDAAVAEAWLHDVGNGALLIGQRFRMTGGSAERLADAVAGAVVEKLLGTPSPFGGRIAFQYRAPGQRWRELALTDWAGGTLDMRSEGQKLVLTPAWAPGRGGVLAVGYRTRAPGLYWFDLARGAEKPVLRAATSMHGVAPLPDGRRVIFSWERNRNTDLYMLDLETGKYEALTSSPAADLAPAVSPDGSKVAFVSDRRGNPFLYQLDLATRKETALVLEGTYIGSPNWSPDGKQLVFLRRDRGVPFAVWTLDVESGQLTRITGDADDSFEFPVWAPDSRTILYSRLEGGSYDLWKVDRLLRKSSRVTQFPGDARMPSWQPAVSK
jgi:TolB protein